MTAPVRVLNVLASGKTCDVLTHQGAGSSTMITSLCTAREVVTKHTVVLRDRAPPLSRLIARGTVRNDQTVSEP